MIDDLKTVAVSVIILATMGLYIGVCLIFPGRPRGGAR